MRLKRIRSGRPSRRRRGEMARVKARKRSVQSPVAWVMNSIGFAPSSWWKYRKTSSSTGTRQRRKTGIFNHRFERTRFQAMRGSVVFAQIHARVEAGHLIAIAIEHEGLALAKLAQAAFGGLTPAGMVDGGVHVRIESILARVGEIPGGGRLLLDKLNLHDGLDAFETVLPGDHQADGRAILIGQSLPVHAETEQRERVHGLVDAQPFH